MKAVLFALFVGVASAVAAGTEYRVTDGTIVNVLKDGYLVRVDDQTIKVDCPVNKVDGDKVSGLLIFEGDTYEYVTVLGKKATVRRYRVLTEKEKKLRLEVALTEQAKREQEKKQAIENYRQFVAQRRAASERARNESYLLWLRQQLTNAPSAWITNELQRIQSQ